MKLGWTTWATCAATTIRPGQPNLHTGNALLFLIAGGSLRHLLLHCRERRRSVHHFPVHRQAVAEAEVAGMSLSHRGRDGRLGHKRGAAKGKKGSE